MSRTSSSSNASHTSNSFHPETIAIHAGLQDDALTGSVCTPIFQTTTFAQTELTGDPAYCYSRTGNPTRDALEKSLAAIEGAPHAFAFSSMKAIASSCRRSTDQQAKRPDPSGETLAQPGRFSWNSLD